MRLAALALLLAGRGQETVRFESGLQELSDVGVAGWHRRLGPDGEDAPKPPLLYQPPSRPCPPARQGQGMTYEVGGPPAKDAGDFSSTQAQVVYAGAGVGIDRVLILDMQNLCLSQKPEPPWWGGFRPEPSVLEWRKKGGIAAGPVGVARGLGSWSNHAVLLFRDGLVATAGTATSQSAFPILRLPADKLPTAVAVTPRNEMALVTVVDLKRKVGQLAVIALESHAPGFAHDWHRRYPLLPNQASFSDLKLLGYVDLPVGLPSAVAGTGDKGWTHVRRLDGNNGLPKDVDLSRPEWRASFAKGSNRDFLSGAGYAVVVSKHEGKAVFVDLQPLFAAVKRAYLEGDPRTRDVGPGPAQWPPAFEAEPSFAPVVTATVDVPRPSSLHVRGRGGEHGRTYVGCEAGELVAFKVGGLGTDGPAQASDVVEAGRLAVGMNPVCLAWKGTPAGADYGFIVVSRGARALQWVRFEKDQGRIVRELRDRRMIDPVHAEIADTHGIQMQLVTVADFKGRKIINYRCSPVVFATNGGAKFGCGPKGEDEFECGGVMGFPGAPFAVCGTNVN